MYDSTLDVAMEVIYDFLNCDPMDIGKLQANTYNTVYNIEKEIGIDDKEKDWVKEYNKWKKTKKICCFHICCFLW